MGTLLEEPRAAAAQAATHPPAVVAWLGYGGLIPFVGLAAAARTVGSLAGIDCRHALLAYAAVILSFVGALHWAFAMTPAPLPAGAPTAAGRDAAGGDAAWRNAAWCWSVVPALAGWIALLVPAGLGALILATGLAADYAFDRRLARLAALPAWYLPLRLRLTTVACLSVLAGVAA